MTRPLLLGHRGARADKTIPENTFGAFDRALADGCDGFEFDVRLSEDLQAVICHDPKIGKLQIARANARQLTGLPRLEEVLVRYRHAFLDIELKVCGLEHILVEQLSKIRPEQFVISSFLSQALDVLHGLDPKLPLGLICETRTQLQPWSDLPVRYVIPHCKLAQRNLIQQLHEADKKVLVWTVNRPEEMERFADWGVDGIISDDTKLLRQTLALKS
jgi:glycerophosphoryl diester phosphodiesterase